MSLLMTEILSLDCWEAHKGDFSKSPGTFILWPRCPASHCTFSPSMKEGKGKGKKESPPT